MILPPGINWDGISLRIPYHQLHRLEEIIRNDYETKTAQNFFDRQSQALQTMQQLKTGNWLQDLGQEIAQLAK
jgi:predicted transcriptional regulator